VKVERTWYLCANVEGIVFTKDELELLGILLSGEKAVAKEMFNGAVNIIDVQENRMYSNRVEDLLLKVEKELRKTGCTQDLKEGA
jgi:hypothetical protein